MHSIGGEDLSESAYEEANIAAFFANEANIAANKAAKAAHEAGSSQHRKRGFRACLLIEGYFRPKPLRIRQIWA